MATVVCFRWFDAFPLSYVKLLRNAVRANLARPHRFICVTDNPRALAGDVERLLAARDPRHRQRCDVRHGDRAGERGRLHLPREHNQ